MRYLLLSSLLFLVTGCTSSYKNLRKSESPACELTPYRPVFHTALYDASIDVIGKHLSGLLLIKQMPDSTLRTVFSNEMGLTYFDFEFGSGDRFAVRSILKQMNKKAVISALRKDFELMLMRKLDKPESVLRDEHYLYLVYPDGKENNYAIFDTTCSRLVKLQSASHRKPKVDVNLMDYRKGIPDSIGIVHHNFSFTIALKRLER